MTQNKTIPLAEKKLDMMDIHREEYSTDKMYFKEEDVKEAVRRLLEELQYVYSPKEYEYSFIEDKVIEIFGSSLCEDETKEKKDD